MDNSLSQTLSGQDLLSSGNASASTGAGLSVSAPIVPSSQPTGVPANPAQNGGGEPGATPVKRKPGRPKGSVKKPTAEGASEAVDSANKIKRPVGRPRKDGLPAGSVSASGSKVGRPRKSALDKTGVPHVHISKPTSGPSNATTFGAPLSGPTFRPYYPPNQPSPQAQYQSTFSISQTNGTGNGPIPQLMYPIDPALDQDEWANLARTNLPALLQGLLASLAAPNPISTAGPSVEEAFKSHLVSLAPNSQKEEHMIPSLYSILKTFWLPSSPAYFSLTASASTARTPSEHRFLYWDPQPLVFNGIACPVCSVPLINRGRIRSGPMKVYDLDKPFFIIGCEYICRSPACVANASPEGRKFASTDSSILSSLPARLRDEFPAHLIQGDGGLGSSPNVWNWQATGVSLSLWNMVRGCLRHGMSRDSILAIVRFIQNGVLDEQSKLEDEEEEEEDELEEERPVPEKDPSAEAQPAASDNAKNVSALDAYNNAWKAHSAIMDPSPNPESTNAHASSSGPPGPSMTMPMSSQSMPSQPVSQPFAFPQANPYVAYPYQPYPHYNLQQQPAAAQSSANAQPQTSSNSGSEQKTLKRPFGYSEAASEVSILEPSQKRTRHCCKCGSQECKGKGGRSFCLNACQDCGKLDCKGRNSRRPDKKCDEAWS